MRMKLRFAPLEKQFVHRPTALAVVGSSKFAPLGSVALEELDALKAYDNV